jgi:peptide chain release factor
MSQQEVWMQLTAGQGPAECSWAVMRVLEEIQKDALRASLACKVIEVEPGPEGGTAQSVLISVAGEAMGLASFAGSWNGTVQWIERSVFRPEHKRKNWFVGISVIEQVDETRVRPLELRWETMRASGPGGQHVNRTESAVRVTHVPTGLQAVAMEERSQHRNRRLALARLLQKVDEMDSRKLGEARRERWRSHQELQRGGPVRVLRAGS